MERGSNLHDEDEGVEHLLQSISRGGSLIVVRNIYPNIRDYTTEAMDLSVLEPFASRGTGDKYGVTQALVCDA